MPRHKKGTLVRVKTQAEADEYDWYHDDTVNVVSTHGWIFQVVRYQSERHPDNDTGEDEYLCKSLATGEEVSLYPREITTKKPKEQDNGNIPSQEASDQAATQV